MKVNINFEVGALFKLRVLKECGRLVKETGFFHNLVLNSGLDRLSQGGAVGFVAVGTGNSEPTAEQTGLDALIAYSNTQIGNIQTGDQLSTAPYYMWQRRVIAFSAGAAAGNISEIGVGWENPIGFVNNMFNRTLIKDALGNPATITVLADEVLEVTVEFRHYPPHGAAGSFNLYDKSGNIVSTHSVNVGFIAWPHNSPSLGKIEVTGKYAELTVYSGGMPAGFKSEPSHPRFEVPSGYTYTKSYPSQTKLLYSPTLQPNQANISHKTLTISFDGLFNLGGGRICCELTPPIVKTSEHSLTYNFEFSWGRHEST